MAFLQLQPHVSYGLVRGRPIFLDLRRDRYLALDPATEAAFLDLHGSSDPDLSPGPARDRLLATGLFRETRLRASPTPAGARQPGASLLDDPPATWAGWRASLRAWRSVTRARRRLAGTALDDIVAELREARYAAPPEGDPSAIEDSARVFIAARSAVPIERNCLLDCLALLDWLGTDLNHARLIFGVRADPFGAHCWLQTERTLLTDARDTIGHFVPVLVV